MSVWAFAFRNIRRNRRRSVMTSGIVVFGFAAFALAGGFVSQSFEALKDGAIRFGTGHLQFARAETFAEAQDGTLEFGILDSDRAAGILRADSRVDAVLPRIDFVGLASNGLRSVPFLGIGFQPSAEGRAMETKSLVASGRWLDDGEEGVVLGTGLARALNVRAGDGLTLFATTPDAVLNALDVTVTGLVEMPVKELNDRYLAITLPAASRLLNVSGVVSKLVVTLKPGTDESAARNDLLAMLRKEEFPLEVRTWQELAVFYGQVKLLYMAIFGFMGLILVVVVLLACANTMTMAVSERIREIGTLRAIGTAPERVRRMFVAEGALLALIGCAAGAVLALILRAALNASGIVLPPPPGNSHGMPIYVAFYPQTYAAGLSAMVVTLVLASYLPARRASKVPIVEALAHV